MSIKKIIEKALETVVFNWVVNIAGPKLIAMVVACIITLMSSILGFIQISVHDRNVSAEKRFIFTEQKFAPNDEVSEELADHWDEVSKAY